MISINEISTPELMRSVFNKKISEINDFIYPFNEFTAHYIRTKNIQNLKSILGDSSSTLTVDFYKQKILEMTNADKHEAIIYMATHGVLPDQTAYVYLSSKASFRVLFHDFLPSAFDLFYNYLSSNNYIHQIGSGQGISLVFTPQVFETDFSNYSSSAPFDYNQAIDYMINDIKNLKEDRFYLLAQVEERDSIISQLLNTINKMEKEQIVKSQMTWH